MSNAEPSAESVLLGVIDLKEAKRLRSILEDRGVHLEFRNNPVTCSSGACGCTIEVHVASASLPIVQALLREERARDLGGLSDSSLSDEVFDTEKESARCPACGTEFATTCKECPDCGLVFISE